jgi:hypothetical protein
MDRFKGLQSQKWRVTSNSEASPGQKSGSEKLLPCRFQPIPGWMTGNTEEIHLDENRPCRKLTFLTGLCREGIIAT